MINHLWSELCLPEKRSQKQIDKAKAIVNNGDRVDLLSDLVLPALVLGLVVQNEADRECQGDQLNGEDSHHLGQILVRLSQLLESNEGPQYGGRDVVDDVDKDREIQALVLLGGVLKVPE